MGDTYHRKKRHVGEDNVEALGFDTESATNDTKVDEHLLDFYRNALDRLEKERKEWLMLLEGCKLAPADEHQQRWQLLRQEEQITALERAVTDARASLHEERERVLQLQEEIDRLRIQETKDRATIQKLLSLTKPITALPTNKDGAEYAHQLPRRIGVQVDRAELERAVSEDEVHSLRLAVQALKAEAEERQKVTEGRIRELEAELRTREEQEQERLARMSEEIRKLSGSLKSSKVQVSTLAHEALKLRNERNSRLRELEEDRRRLYKDVEAEKASYRQSKQEMQRELEELRAKQLDDAENLDSQHRQQLIHAESQLAQLAAEYEKFKETVATKASTLKQQCETAKRRLKAEEAARKRDKEGFEADLKSVRQQLKSLQSHMTRLTAQVTGSAAERDLLALQEIHDTNVLTYELATNLQEIKARINTLTNAPYQACEPHASGFFL